MAVDVKTFLAKVEEIAAEEPGYKLGHYGQDGYCDCIGLVIGAIRRAGGQWRGTHGSNYAARSEVKQLQQIVNSGTLKPGELVFKAWSPSQEKYALPAKYQKGGESYNGDLLDYYHVGIVVSVSPLRIRHMTTPMPKMDTTIGKWAWHGWPLKVSDKEQGSEDSKMANAKVVPTSTSVGDTVNLRASASKGAKILESVPFYSEIEVLEDLGQWCKIGWKGVTGYMMSDFIEYGGADGETNEIKPEQLVKIDEMLSKIEKNNEVISQLLIENDEYLDVIGTIVGRG